MDGATMLLSRYLTVWNWIVGGHFQYSFWSACGCCQQNLWWEYCRITWFVQYTSWDEFERNGVVVIDVWKSFPQFSRSSNYGDYNLDIVQASRWPNDNRWDLRWAGDFHRILLMHHPTNTQKWITRTSSEGNYTAHLPLDITISSFRFQLT